MKHQLLILALLGALTAHAQLRLPAQSPSATLKQAIGLTELEISYSRPSMRERQIFGPEALLPHGAPWRVGANAATKITLSDQVSVDGTLLPEGAYTLLAWPGPKTWRLSWYAYDSTDWTVYMDLKPVLELEIPIVKNNTEVETLEFRFQEVSMNSAVLLIEWERIQVRIPLRVDEEKKIARALKRSLNGPSQFDYYFAALYLHESQTDLERALTYIQKVTDSDTAQFFQVSREAMILNDLGQTQAAKKVAQRGLELSQKAGNNDFVRINRKIIDQ